MRAIERLGRSRRSGLRPGLGLVAGLSLAAVLGPATLAAAPAAATDDGEDLSDLLVDEMPGYVLAPLGDPLTGGTGPIDWDEVGDSGPADGVWPEDMPSYVKSYFSAQGLTAVMLVAFDPEDLPESAMVAGFAQSLEDEGGRPLTLPRADTAGVDYEAFVVRSPGLSDSSSFSMAAFADDGIVVALYVDTMRGDGDVQRSALDDFVTAQVDFEPVRTPTDDRIGRDDDPTGEGAAASSQQAGGDGDDGRSTATRIGLATMWVVAMSAIGLLVWLIAQGRRTRPGAATAGGSAAWPMAGGPVPFVPPGTGTGPVGGPPTHPPLPPAASPPIAVAARRPPPPVAPPPSAKGGLRTQRHRPASDDIWRAPG